MRRFLTPASTPQEGNLAWSVVVTYLKNGGGVLVFGSILLLFAAEQGARAYTDLWVGNWFSDRYDFVSHPSHAC